MSRNTFAKPVPSESEKSARRQMLIVVVGECDEDHEHERHDRKHRKPDEREKQHRNMQFAVFIQGKILFEGIHRLARRDQAVVIDAPLYVHRPCGHE